MLCSLWLGSKLRLDTVSAESTIALSMWKSYALTQCYLMSKTNMCSKRSKTNSSGDCKFVREKTQARYARAENLTPAHAPWHLRNLTCNLPCRTDFGALWAGLLLPDSRLLSVLHPSFRFEDLEEVSRIQLAHGVEANDDSGSFGELDDALSMFAKIVLTQRALLRHLAKASSPH